MNALTDVAALCSDLGHDVKEAAPVVSDEVVTQAFLVLWSAGVASTLDAIAFLKGQAPNADKVEPLTWGLYEMGREHTASQYLLALQTLQGVSRQVAQFFQTYDVWLTPTLAEPPVPLGSFDSTPEEPLAGLMRAVSFVPFTPICNVTGQPAMSMPLSWNAEGLPVGTHFVGRFGDEATLFRLASQLEEARPWSGRRPRVGVSVEA
jgi:amidase